jgi:hypothetical protein
VGAEYRGLGFDPAPGSADAVREAADRCRRAAAHAEAAARDLLGIAEWEGRAAESFTARTDAVAGEVAAMPDAMRRAAAILDTWADTLLADQREADLLDRRALELRRMVDRADDGVADATRALQVAIGSAARTAYAEHVAALAKRTQLAEQLAAVLDQARALENDHAEAARRTAEQLRTVDEDGAAEGDATVDQLFGTITQALGGFSSRAGELAVTLLGPPTPIPAARTGAVATFAGALSTAMGAPAHPTGPGFVTGPGDSGGPGGYGRR